MHTPDIFQSLKEKKRDIDLPLGEKRTDLFFFSKKKGTDLHKPLILAQTVRPAM